MHLHKNETVQYTTNKNLNKRKRKKIRKKMRKNKEKKGVCLLRLVWVFESKVSLDSSFLWGMVVRQKVLTL